MHQCACNFHELFLLTHAINHTIVHAPSYLMIPSAVGGGAWENRGQERYWRRERKGREAGVQRWRDAGVKCKTLLVDISYALEYLKNKNERWHVICINFISVIRQTKIRTWSEKQAYYRLNTKPWESKWVTGLHGLLVWFWRSPRVIALQTYPLEIYLFCTILSEVSNKLFSAMADFVLDSIVPSVFVWGCSLLGGAPLI